MAQQHNHNHQQAITKEQAIAKLKGLQSSLDTPSAHIEADDILCLFLHHLGHSDLVVEYRKIHKWFD